MTKNNLIMRLSLFLLTPLCILLTLSPLHAAPLNLYVSMQGRDDWSGMKDKPGRGGHDGPLATLEGARSRIHALKEAGGLPREGVIVNLHSGVYHLHSTFALTAEDDTSPAPVTYRAYKNEAVRVDGGQEVSGWTPVTDPATLDRLDPAARGHVLQADLKAQGITNYGTLSRRGFGLPVTPAALELFFNDAPMTLARWPNAGQWATVAGTAADQGADHFTYSGDRPARWIHADDAWVHGYWTFDWADSYEKILGVDPTSHQIRTAPTGDLLAYTPQHRWYALNLLEELDEPGEWYLDRKTGLLYFWPPSDIAQGHAIVSLVGDLIRLDHVSHVTLRGLTLEACRGTAVSIHDGANDLLAGCTIRDAGNRGVDIVNGTDVGVQSCDISETGDGGIVLNGGDRKTLTPGGCFVVNCHLSRYSRWDLTYRPGVEVEGVGNRVAHNLIEDAPHEGIQLSGNDHLIEYNEIHHVCLQTGDSGAFYMGRDWTMRGNVVRFNYFHDLGGGKGLLGDTDVNAIYLDDTAAGTTVSGNVCVRAGRGVLVGGGRDNSVTNNVFVDCKPAVSLDARGIGWAAKYLLPGGGWDMQGKLAAVPYDRPPYSTRYPHLATVLQDNPAAPKYDVIAQNVAFHCPNWLDVEQAAKPGVRIENNLSDADPQFVDPAHGNYQLKPGSPAFKLGFQRIPFDKMGLYKDEYRSETK